MNKSIGGIMILGSLVAFSTLVACDSPAPAAIERPSGSVTPAPVVTTIRLVFGDNPPDDQIVLNEVEMATRNLIADLIMAGQPVSDCEWTILRSIEAVRPALKQLEDQRMATQAIINRYVVAGQPVPAFECAMLDSIEQARLESLRRIGFAY